MENKYKIIVSYIQDLSVEIPSPETLVTVRTVSYTHLTLPTMDSV